MNDVNILAAQAIYRAKNLQEFLVFRDMNELVFDGSPLPYTITHVRGCRAEILVPAISQTEAEHRVDAWLKSQRA